MDSKLYTDKRRGAKESDLKVGDKVVIAVQRKTKTDPSFSQEKYTILSREGGKVVIRSERGVQYARNIQDVKLAPYDVHHDVEESDRINHSPCLSNQEELGTDSLLI